MCGIRLGTLYVESGRYLPVILCLKKIELLLDAFQCIGNGKFDWALRWWSLHTMKLEMKIDMGDKTQLAKHLIESHCNILNTYPGGGVTHRCGIHCCCFCYITVTI